MLFKQIHLQGILTGKVTLAFRKWDKPSVNKGSIIKTSIGQVEILDITTIDQKKINEIEAILAGYQSLNELQSNLDKRTGCNIYRIEVRYHSEDPRIALRNNTDITVEEFQIIKKKLNRFDSNKTRGAWTLLILNYIKNNPHVRAQDISDDTGFEKDWLKPNIRKLKNLGLTISQPVGYSLSPLGKIILDRMTNEVK